MFVLNCRTRRRSNPVAASSSGAPRKHDHGILAPQFERKRNQSFGSGNGDFPACDSAARKANIIHVPDQFVAHIPGAVNKSEEIRIEPALDEKIAGETAESGVNSDGLTTTALPASNAGRASAIPSRNG